jgi:CRISPR-associated endonuclease/helicase Cas3
VGTVDQALLPILPVRHNFVRLWGMANRVVVFDEIHAYDAYTGTLLIHLLRWLMALGASVVLLSATLPPAIRRKLAHMVGSVLPASDTKYPRLSILQQGAAEQIHFEAASERRRTLRLAGISPEQQEIRAALVQHLANGGLGLALMNTVQRAQELYMLFPEGEPLVRNGQRTGKRLSDGTEVYLFHARYPADRRQQREENALALFGRDSTRGGRKILIATQVAEQSLDLDIDLIVSDLAPIDLLLQRAGRLWRHARGKRPISEPAFIIAGLSGDEPPALGTPLWWKAVYREDLLVRTWSLLRERDQLTLPDEIDDLVQAVYDEQAVVAESIQEWLDKAMIDAEGETYAQRIQANQAIIGFPDDASWDDPARFVLFDEDEPGVHKMLLAKTRLGEASVVVVPLQAEDRRLIETPPTFAQAKQWYQTSVSLSRKGVVQKFQQLGVPQAWQQSSLLRNCYPMFMDLTGRWIEDDCIRLDEELGVVYESKEAE